jgi:hypothetical protein
MDIHQAQRAHESTLQSIYDREHDDTPYFRNYVLMACTHLPNESEPETLTDYYAFHEGDSSDVPACVRIACNLNGVWTWGACGCDYDEAKATRVHSLDALLPHEVQREFQAWLVKRETLTDQLALTRAEMVNVAANYPSHVYAALALRAAHLHIELKQLEVA